VQAERRSAEWRPGRGQQHTARRAVRAGADADADGAVHARWAARRRHGHRPVPDDTASDWDAAADDTASDRDTPADGDSARNAAADGDSARNAAADGHLPDRHDASARNAAAEHDAAAWHAAADHHQGPVKL